MKCESWLWVSVWVWLHPCAMNLLYIWLSVHLCVGVCVCVIWEHQGAVHCGEKEGELSGNSSYHESFMSICICVCVCAMSLCMLCVFIACKSPDLPWNKKRLDLILEAFRECRFWSLDGVCRHGGAPPPNSALTHTSFLLLHLRCVLLQSVFCCWLNCWAFLFRATNTPKIIIISICWLTASQSINKRDKVTIKRLFILVF